MDRAEACRILNLPSDRELLPDEIAHSYRELAKKYHPDHNRDGIAHEMFVRIGEAHDLLTGRAKDKPKPHPAAAPRAPTSATSDADAFRRQAREFFEEQYNAVEGLLKRDQTLSNVRLPDLQDVCRRVGVCIDKLSDATHRPVRRTKNELFILIRRLPGYQILKKRSYDELVAMCEERHIPVTVKNMDRDVRKSVEELIVSLL